MRGVADPADYGFVGREPHERPPELSEEQVGQLCRYIEALATVRAEQLSELGLAEQVAPVHSPDWIRGHAKFLRNLYRTEALRRA